MEVVFEVSVCGIVIIVMIIPWRGFWWYCCCRWCWWFGRCCGRGSFCINCLNQSQSWSHFEGSHWHWTLSFCSFYWGIYLMINLIDRLMNDWVKIWFENISQSLCWLLQSVKVKKSTTFGAATWLWYMTVILLEGGWVVVWVLITGDAEIFDVFLLTAAHFVYFCVKISLLYNSSVKDLSLIHIWRCRRYAVCRSRWSPYH